MLLVIQMIVLGNTNDVLGNKNDVVLGNMINTNDVLGWAR